MISVTSLIQSLSLEETQYISDWLRMCRVLMKKEVDALVEFVLGEHVVDLKLVLSLVNACSCVSDLRKGEKKAVLQRIYAQQCEVFNNYVASI